LREPRPGVSVSLPVSRPTSEPVSVRVGTCADKLARNNRDAVSQTLAEQGYQRLDPQSRVIVTRTGRIAIPGRSSGLFFLRKRRPRDDNLVHTATPLEYGPHAVCPTRCGPRLSGTTSERGRRLTIQLCASSPTTSQCTRMGPAASAPRINRSSFDTRGRHISTAEFFCPCDA